MADPAPTLTLAEAIHRIQLRLLETRSSPLDRLLAAGTLLSRPDYEDIVVERSIANLCGYPLCPNPLPSDPRRHGRYRVSLREHRVYDLQETYKFCSDGCVANSRAFSGSLEEERCSDIRAARTEQVLALFGHGEREEEEQKGMGKDRDLGISKLEIRERRDGGAAEVTVEDWIGPSNAIEGYVPLRDRDSKFTGSSDSRMAGDETDGIVAEGASVIMEDASETLAKELENVVLTEKKKKTNRISPKSSATKTHKKVKSNKTGDLEFGETGFTSSIMFGDGVDSQTASFTTQDVSEMIAKQLEDVVLEEKKMEASRSSSKSSNLKSKKKGNRSKSDNVDFKSTIVIDDRLNAVAPNTASVSMQNYSEQLGKELQDKLHLGQETVLKSSLKALGSKGGNRSVKWADEEKIDTSEERNTVFQQVQEEDDNSSLRLASAEACAAALTRAAEAAASGAVEAEDAVNEAGILILPQVQHGKEGDSELDEDMFEFDRGVLKWPQKTVLLDTDMFEVEDSWHDTPPEGFSLSLSTFATMYMALFGWITCSSLAYIYGRDESSHEDFLLVNGREYPRKISLGDGKSSEIRQALDGFICRALPGLIRDLRLQTPVSTLEKFVGRLLDTMSFFDALPSFRIRQWQVIVFLFLDALSVHRLPSLGPHMTNRDLLRQKVLSAGGVSSEEYETMRDLFIPLGRLPQFSMQSGG